MKTHPWRAATAVLLLLPPLVAAADPATPGMSAGQRAGTRGVDTNGDVTADFPTVSRVKYNFNSGWLLKVGDDNGAEATTFSDRDWKKVSLPYAWNEDSAFKTRIQQLPTGVAWYRKHFKLPANATGKKVFLEFEGIRHGGEFFLNGKSIGLSENGVMAFGFDITDKLNPAPQQNVLAARIDNAWNYKEAATRSGFQWNDRNFYANYGGINKNVFLHVTDKLHQTLPLYSNLGTTGVYIHAHDFDIPGKSASISAESQVRNEHAEPTSVSYEVLITDAQGKLVKTFGAAVQTLAPGETKVLSAHAKVDGLNFWSWGYGYLYDVTTLLKVGGQPVDAVVTRTGFRKLEFAKGVIKLNGRTIQIKGYAQRSTNEWPAVGQAVPPWMSDFSNALAVEGNANLFRWMHVTPGKQDIESCDRVGLMQVMPAGDSERDVDGRRWELRVLLMRDAVIYNRNNPSIVMYEGGNKGISEAHMSELRAVRDTYDPHGGRAAGAREMLGSNIAEYGGEMLYINKSAQHPLWATEYSRDEAQRKYWDQWTPPHHKDGDGPEVKPGESGAPYNRNQDTFAVEEVARWVDFWRERPGTGTRVSSGGVKILFSDSNTHARGAQTYRTSGAVDPLRLPKDAFYVQQVMWDGWVNVERARAYIVGHWNYEAGVSKPIHVVASTDKVELFVNHQSKGFGEQSSRFLYTWKDVRFQAGEIRAVGYDAAGRKVCENVKMTAGKPAAVRLTPRTGPHGLQADGADLALVDVEIVDAQGHRCPTALNLVKFNLQGPAEWRGGIAQGPDNCILASLLPMECGINRVILRSSPQAGTIVLSASSQDLKSASIQLRSTAAPGAEGVSKVLPDAGLRARLDRGPTPAGDSVVATRKAVQIVSATAGANTGQAGQAFDDNEATGWKNDGKRATGWIEMKLERPATVSEVELKLGGWRSKSYPLRISVDGKQVYSGKTPKSLGYVTLPVRPTRGTNLRIELMGAVDESDGFGMVEITGKKLQDTADHGARGTLEIIEVEVYEPLTAPFH